MDFSDFHDFREANKKIGLSGGVLKQKMSVLRRLKLTFAPKLRLK